MKTEAKGPERGEKMDELKDYPIVISIPVKWGEMDAFGHVNNTTFFRYFEDVRITYLYESGLIEAMTKLSMGPILAHTSCRYLKPLVYPDTVEVGTRMKSCGISSLVMEYLIESPKAGVAAKGDGVIVVYDYKKAIKVNVPAEIKKRILDVEKREIDSCDIDLSLI